MEKKYVATLMDAFVENYKREDRIAKALDEEGITFESASTPYGHAVEDILYSLNENLCQYLCDFAQDDFIYLNGRDIDSIDKLYEELFHE